MDPLQYAIYKGTGGKHGAVQFNLQRPNFYIGKRKDFEGRVGDSDGAAFRIEDGRKVLKDGWKQREGAIFMQITSTKGRNIYDWENKIIMALSINDIGKVMMCLLTGEECSLMHDPGAKTQAQGTIKKYLNISSPKGVATGIILTATQVSGSDKRTHTVPMTGDEVIILKSLLQQATSRALNW